MTARQRRELRELEGRMVHLALANGSRFDEVSLVSARSRTVWVFSGGEDRFIPTAEIVDAWEAAPLRSAA
jgi:hypothetical protein